MTGRILEANSFVYVQNQLAHCVGREVTALLTGKQRTLWICEAYIITILAESLSQALIELHRACLPTFALLCGRSSRSFRLFEHPHTQLATTLAIQSTI